jgi:hypothetical protein
VTRTILLLPPETKKNIEKKEEEEEEEKKKKKDWPPKSDNHDPVCPQADTNPPQQSLPLRPPLMRLTEGGGHTAASSLCGSSNADSNSNLRGSNAETTEDRTAIGSRFRRSCASDGSRGSHTGGGGPGPAAGRRVSAVGGMRRRSALGAVMEAVGDRAVDSQEQVGPGFEQARMWKW